MTEKTVEKLIENIERVNEHVTKGSWWMDSHGEALVCFTGNGMEIIVEPKHQREKAHRDENTGGLSYWNNDSDASWIALANPENVMMLVNEIKRLKEAENVRK